jgi:hypothetical protein
MADPGRAEHDQLAVVGELVEREQRREEVGNADRTRVLRDAVMTWRRL